MNGKFYFFYASIPNIKRASKLIQDLFIILRRECPQLYTRQTGEAQEVNYRYFFTHSDTEDMYETLIGSSVEISLTFLFTTDLTLLTEII